MKHRDHILVIRLSAMGDVAMTVPVIRALIEQHPDILITVVSRPFFKPFFDGIPRVNFFPVDLKERHQGFLGVLRLFSDLRKLKITKVADLHNVLRSKILRTLFFLIGIKVAATDKGRNEKKALTRLKNKIFKPVTSMFDRHVLTFQKLGYKIDLNFSTFRGKEELKEEVVEISGLKEKYKWIGIAPFAQYESKVYPLDLMQVIIDELSKDMSKKIFLFGGGVKETQQLFNLKKNYPNVIVVAGKLSLNYELNLIQNLDLMLSMDSGNAHIAAMLGVKVITLWGATHPYAGFKPFNQPLDHCITSDREKYPLLPTSVYGNKHVEGYEDVMRSISPQYVVDKVYSSI